MVTASRQEHRAIASGLNLGKPLPAKGSPRFVQRPAGDWIVVHTGMGPQATRDQLTCLLKQYPCAGLLSVGYCGALVERLHSGDIVLCLQCGRISHPGIVERWNEASPEWVQKLQFKLRMRGLPFYTILCATSSAIVSSVSEKRRLGQVLNASVVEMESAALFEVALERNLPCAGLRVVLDEMSHSLVELEGLLDSEGHFLPGARRKLLMASPQTALRLARAERKAAQVLALIAEVVVS